MEKIQSTKSQTCRNRKKGTPCGAEKRRETLLCDCRGDERHGDKMKKDKIR